TAAPAPRVVTPPGPGDIGFCLPVTFQFRSNNLNGWRFLFTVLQKFPMSELDQVSMLTDPGTAESGDNFFQVRFLFAPYVFGVQVPKPEDVKAEAAKAAAAAAKAP